MMEPRIQYAKASDGVSIAYATLGEGPPIVFATRVWGDIHVYTAVEQFRPYIRALAERGRRVIFYDGRGMGSSQRDATDFGLAGRVLDLEAVVEAIGSDRVALCGSQSGGPAAIAYSARHQERVSHLVLVNTAARGADYLESTPSLRVARDLIHIAEDQWEFYTLALASAFMAFSDIETARQIAATIRAGVSPKVWIADRAAMEQIDVTDLLASIAVPALVVHNRADTIGDFSMQASKLASHIPDARFAATDDVVGVIDRFLREGDPTAETQLPSGMSAILFADIVDSTALTERLGDDAFREKARGLDEAMRAAIRDNGGTPVEGKTLGDGVLAVFTSAKQAIACAQACHDAAGAAGLLLHAGIHAGDVIREADNVYGGAVNIAARVAAASAAGETLVSGTVRDLARTSAGVRFEDRGDHELKGVSDAVRVWAVRADTKEE
jgi:class 3 adenylate cyclase